MLFLKGMNMTDTPPDPAAPLPQPPREGGQDPVPAPAAPQEAAQDQQEARERKRITLTAARDLVSRGGSLTARYTALVGALGELGIDGSETSGLRGQLNEAFVELREGAAHIDNANRLIGAVGSALEEL